MNRTVRAMSVNTPATLPLFEKNLGGVGFRHLVYVEVF